MINNIKKKVIAMIHASIHNSLLYSFSFFRILFLCITFTIVPTAMGMVGFPDLANLSPEEMEALERELEQFARGIDEYVSNLSPEQQAEFHAQVEEAERMMASMSEEELQQFFGEILAQELAQAGQEMPPQQVAQPTKPVAAPATPEVVKPRITSSEQDRALALIDSIIQRTDAFLVKMNNVPDLSLRIKRWVASKKVAEPTANTSWETIKANIELLKQSLYKLKELDPKTNQYRFIGSFTKNNALYNALNTLESILSTQEPRITVSSFGIEMLNTQSKNAIVVILNSYMTALQTATADFITLFGEFAPEAQKLKEEQAKWIEQARAEAAKPKSLRGARVAGSREPEDFGRGGYGSSDFDRGGYGYDYGYPYGSSSQTPTTPTQEQPTKEKKESKGGGGKGGGSSKTKKDKDKKDKDKEKEEEEKKKEKPSRQRPEKDTEEEKPQKPGEQPAGTPQPETTKPKPITCPISGAESPEGALQLIKSNLEHITQLLKDAPKTQHLHAELVSKEEPDMSLALVTLPGLERRVKRLGELVTHYLAMQDNSQEAKSAITALIKQYPVVGTFESQLQSINDASAAGKLTVPVGKLYAYFAQMPENEEAQAALTSLKKAIPHPVSLLVIFSHLQKIKEQLEIPALSQPEPEKKPEPKNVEEVEKELEKFVEGLSPEMKKLFRQAEEEAMREGIGYVREQEKPVPLSAE